MVPRAVLIERPTEYQALLARHGTRDQARFYLEQRGQSIDEVEARHRRHRAYHAAVLGAVPPEWRRASIQREDLDRFLFTSDDVVVVLGQDGLVANAAKYLDGQPVIGLNPDPERYPGILVAHPPEAGGDLLRDAISGRAHTEYRTMVAATLDDGQTLTALNEIFIGHATHQSARYRITLDEQTEQQSSSGIVIATGTGATGWAASLHRERHSTLRLPDPQETRLAFFVREPWPSATTGTTITEGALDAGEELEVISELADGGVVFGDGIETDRLAINWGQRIRTTIADRTLELIR